MVVPAARQGLRRLAAAATVAVALLGLPAAAGADEPAAAARVQALAGTVLASYADRASPADPRVFDDGRWLNGDTACWTCNAAPGVAAAVLGTQTSDPGLLARATATFDTAIADHARADGSFAGAGGTAAAGVDTAFFLRDLGIAALELRASADAVTRARWSTAMRRGADFLIDEGHTRFYANGNLNLLYTEDLYLAWRVTGERRFLDAYEASWAFTLAPPKPRWAGYGLRVTRRATRSGGADGRAHLAESGGGRPGFDPAYTEVQADTAASLWSVSRDPRALELMQLLLNTVVRRVDATGTLDARGGTRRDLLEPLMTPAVAVAVRAAGRTDLAPLLERQLDRIESEYRGALGFTHQNFYRGLGSWLSTTLVDAGVGASLPAAVPAGAARGNRALTRRVG